MDHRFMTTNLFLFFQKNCPCLLNTPITSAITGYLASQLSKQIHSSHFFPSRISVTSLVLVIQPSITFIFLKSHNHHHWSLVTSLNEDHWVSNMLIFPSLRCERTRKLQRGSQELAHSGAHIVVIKAHPIVFLQNKIRVAQYIF